MERWTQLVLQIVQFVNGHASVDVVVERLAAATRAHDIRGLCQLAATAATGQVFGSKLEGRGQQLRPPRRHTSCLGPGFGVSESLWLLLGAQMTCPLIPNRARPARVPPSRQGDGLSRATCLSFT
jgi:hypothetical protein